MTDLRIERRDDIDRTHDPARRSWVESGNSHRDFPIQNLPFGVFSRRGETPRGGIAIGDSILDLTAAIDLGLFNGDALCAAQAATGGKLNPLMALGRQPRTALRQRVGDLLDAAGLERSTVEPLGARFLVPAADCAMHVPATIGDYTDFFAGIHHARNAGRLLRPDHPLLPNYKYIPIGYHGRASSIVASGARVRRPNGQLKRSGAAPPVFGPTTRLDYELELGVWIGPGNARGEPIAIDTADDHLVGLCLLNDWSARDIQAWEAQPLGPFLAKNFLTSISPWIVTREALAPFRCAPGPRPDGDPRPLDYLWSTLDQARGGFRIGLEAHLSTAGLEAAGLPPFRVSQGNAVDLYWTAAQLIAHHTCGGCNLNSGDLFGTGTVSGPDEGSYGSLLETTEGGRKPLMLPSGETRDFLQMGDTVIFHARCQRPGYASIGFGECRGTVDS